MTDEEKKAIETFREYINFCENNIECREELNQCFGCSIEVEEINSMKTLLNLIEKQQEKIESQKITLELYCKNNNIKEKAKNKEYEKQLDLDYVDKNYIHKNKLREILEDNQFMTTTGRIEFYQRELRELLEE